MEEKEYTEYVRLSWPYYQEYMEAHEDEWAEETSTIGEDVLIPKEWTMYEHYT